MSTERTLVGGSGARMLKLSVFQALAKFSDLGSAHKARKQFVASLYFL